jgi:CO/xanthine dehydrogenase FAD-binding subunit
MVTGPATVARAIGGGRKAANSIDRHLRGTEAGTEARDGSGARDPARFNSACLKRMARVQTPELSMSERMESMDIEEIIGLDSGDAEAEANRCFNCGCVAVSPSDLAPALIVLDAKIKTSKRILKVEEFFAVGVDKSTLLADDEIVTEIQIPKPKKGIKSKFIKFAPRKSIDFPVVNCATAIESQEGVIKTARICLNAVYNIPYRATEAEKAITGNSIDESTAEAAANAAVTPACPLTKNAYKMQVSRALVKRTILACT